MSGIKQFLNLLKGRLCQPLSSAYQLLPQKIKNYLTLSNLQLFALCFLILTLLANYLLPRDKLFQAKIGLAHWPLSVKKHLQVSQTLFVNGDLKGAEEELNRAKNLYSSFGLFDFGEQIKKEIEKTEQLTNQPQEIKKQIKQWQEILESKPNFRDAHLKLAILNYQLWQEEMAKENWDKAFYLDPNNSQVEQVKKLIKAENDQ